MGYAITCGKAFEFSKSTPSKKIGLHLLIGFWKKFSNKSAETYLQQAYRNIES